MRISAGPVLAGKGDPVTGVKEPSALILKTETLSVKLLVTNKKLPVGSMTAALGLDPPAGPGVPLSVKVPSLATLKI